MQLGGTRIKFKLKWSGPRLSALQCNLSIFVVETVLLRTTVLPGPFHKVFPVIFTTCTRLFLLSSLHACWTDLVPSLIFFGEGKSICSKLRIQLESRRNWESNAHHFIYLFMLFYFLYIIHLFSNFFFCIHILSWEYHDEQPDVISALGAQSPTAENDNVEVMG